MIYGDNIDREANRMRVIETMLAMLLGLSILLFITWFYGIFP